MSVIPLVPLLYTSEYRIDVNLSLISAAATELHHQSLLIVTFPSKALVHPHQICILGSILLQNL